jgi:hypothetical protein
MPKINNPLNMKGEALISKQNLGLGANDVLVTSGYTAEDKVINAQWLPEITGLEKNASGTLEPVAKTMGPRINFIGDCAVRQNPDGTITIRIGENLNSSTFGTTDGQTDGVPSVSPGTTSSLVVAGGTAKNVWKSGTSDWLTVSSSEKIHFDSLGATYFTLTFTTAAGVNSYTFGPVSGNGYYSNGSATVLDSAPSGVAAYMQVTGWGEEDKKSEGATGFAAKVIFNINVKTLATETGDISVKITSTGTTGSADFSKNAICYYLVDTTCGAKITGVSGIMPASPTTATFAGITYVKAGTITYRAQVEDLDKPATTASNGAKIKFDNTANFASDIAAYSQTTYTGKVEKTTTVLTGGVFTSLNGQIKATVYNINGTPSLTGNVYDSNGNQLSGLVIYTGSAPNSSLLGTGNRMTTDGTKAYSDAAAPGTDDLMIYQNSLQYPSAFITKACWKNENYVAPSTTGNKTAVFKWNAVGTEQRWHS